jgi:hypothetical protein
MMDKPLAFPDLAAVRKAMGDGATSGRVAEARV